MQQPPQPNEVTQRNHELCSWCVDVWRLALKKEQLAPGWLDLSPGACLVAARHNLTLGEDHHWLSEDGTTNHRDAYTWWSECCDQAGVHLRQEKQQRKIEGIMLDPPLPLWLLWLLDTAFDEAAPTFGNDANLEEVVYEPETTLQRLHAALYVVLEAYQLDAPDLYERLNTPL